MKKTIRNLIVVATIALAGVALVGCSTNTATTVDQKATNSQLQTYEQTQPIPANTWSQYRQTVIDIEQAQIHGVATTTFFYNMGSNVPIKSCSSIGYPVPTTSQLTNPTQISYGGNINGNTGEYGVIDQQEPNGVYTGSSSGTYVVCVRSDGSKAPDYWEGTVDTEAGAAHFDLASGTIVDDGGSTVATKTK